MPFGVTFHVPDVDVVKPARTVSEVSISTVSDSQGPVTVLFSDLVRIRRVLAFIVDVCTSYGAVSAEGRRPSLMSTSATAQ